MTVECIKFKSFTKGSLLGFADLRLEKIGMEIYGCSLHQKNGRRWVNLPSRDYQDENGEKKYLPHVRFIHGPHYTAFIEQAVKAIEKYCAQNFSEDNQKQDEVPAEAIPF